MKQLLDKMRDALPPGSRELREFKNLINVLYKEDSEGFYVNAPPKEMKKSGKDQVIKYMMSPNFWTSQNIFRSFPFRSFPAIQ